MQIHGHGTMIHILILVAIYRVVYIHGLPIFHGDIFLLHQIIMEMITMRVLYYRFGMNMNGERRQYNMNELKDDINIRDEYKGNDFDVGKLYENFLEKIVRSSRNFQNQYYLLSQRHEELSSKFHELENEQVVMKRQHSRARTDTMAAKEESDRMKKRSAAAEVHISILLHVFQMDFVHDNIPYFMYCYTVQA